MSRILTAVLAVAAVCCVASLAKADGAPSRVTDLAITIMGKTTAVLTFTDSGDDCMDGTAASYEVRYSTSPITAANFGSASLAGTGTPAGAGGTADCFSVPSGKLTCGGTTYYFAIQFTDGSGFKSPGVSNTPSGSTHACNGAEVFCP